MDTTPIACPVCKSASASLVYQVQTTQRFDLRRCAACRLVFVLPRPSEDELREYYESGYFANNSGAKGYGNYNAVGENHARRMWPEFCTYAGIEPASPAAILDVGCATGGFLLEAKNQGWKAKGIELSEEAVSRATSFHGLDVELGDLFTVVLQPASFQMVTMWHVLEHLIDPAAALRIWQLLTPGGKLFIEVPNWHSLGRVVKGRRWGQIQPPGHINYFSAKSLAFAATQSGFRVIRCSTLYVKGFDRLKANPRLRLLRRTFMAAEGAVGWAGYGGYLRLLAGKAE